ncbi:hypothetical protein Sango_2015800 [Sesamum angolense]|uniref:DUF6821 domain-containing protein n=1 Tax=Sesamum angolense TaxID=2727404 RepID=A0AAE1WFI6_9LAMI|nr:hypothetical protein Sango_2015800 [Sesamum angolense]
MDLEEWELLPDEGFLEINDDGGKKLLYSKASTTKATGSVVDEKEATKIIPVESTDTMMMMMMMTTMPATTTSEKKMKPVLSSGGTLGADQDPAVSQVFFKKMKETEFVDMKVESPRGGTSSRGIMPQIEGAGVFILKRRETVIPAIKRLK